MADTSHWVSFTKAGRPVGGEGCVPQKIHCLKLIGYHAHLSGGWGAKTFAQQGGAKWMVVHIRRVNILGFHPCLMLMIGDCTKYLLLWLLTVLCGYSGTLTAQPDIDFDTEAFEIQKIFHTALNEGQAYRWLYDMSTQIGHRLSGSPGMDAAIGFTRMIMDTLGLDSVWLQPAVVPRWLRGEPEVVHIADAPSGGIIRLNALSLGNTDGTGPDGVEARVIEVMSIDELKEMPDELVEGRIVFFNRPMEQGLVNPFHAYGRTVDQRWLGPVTAARKGAVAAVVRSMTHALDDVPHTGVTQREEGNNIPAVAISTLAAETLSTLLRQGDVHLYLRTTSQMLDSVISYNVIGQINGTERPDEIILVGGHLDSWDVGHGAHDDGAGCVHALDVMHLFGKLEYRPRRTIRCVLFTNEENGLTGAHAYADASNAAGDFHLAAIESDAGGFLPRGFGCGALPELQEQYLRAVATWWGLLEPYGLTLFAGGGGADIGPLRPQGGMLFGLRPDSQRYFDYHHTEEDTIDKVNPRELLLGSAAMTALVYLLDKFAVRL